MKHEVNWNADIIINFVKYGKLNNEQIKIMQLRTSNHSDIEIAQKCNISVPTYYRRVKELKKIYRDNNYDIVHIHGNSRTVVLDLLAAKIGGSIGMVHSHSTSCNHILIHRLAKPVFKLLDTKLTNCKWW